LLTTTGEDEEDDDDEDNEDQDDEGNQPALGDVNAERLCGASASAAKAAAAATRVQVQRGLFVDASIGLPLGV
jgi:hypothetical protein